MKSSFRNRSLGVLLGTVAALSTMAGFARADDIEVAYLSASSANTWLAESLVEMKKVAEANGIKLTEFDAQFDPAKQTWLNVAAPPPGFMYTDPIALQARTEPNATDPTNVDPALAAQDMALIEVRSVYDTDGLNRMSDPMLTQADLPAGCTTSGGRGGGCCSPWSRASA